MAHVAGLVAAGLYPNPLPHADVVTTTTHKTLRGPRGGLILARANEEIAKKLNSMVFPGIQGGPLMHVIAAKAVALLEALQPEFKRLPAPGARERARHGGAAAPSAAFRSSPGGTDNHLFLMSLVGPQHHRQGRRRGARARQHHGEQERGAERPAAADGHQRPADRHAGLDHAWLPRRRGGQVADFIAEVLDAEGAAPVVERVRGRVLELCRRFPVYGT